MDAVFLRKHVGESLVICLAEVAEKRPKDPIEYIGQWLHNHIKNQQHQKQVNEANEQLNKAKEEAEVEKKRKEIMDEEEKEFNKQSDAQKSEVKDKESKSGSELSTLVE
ncbi:hypothetical protein LOTGIDRAFT_229340 [Lottia gigantea]|uniref:DPY30 domain-containing protein 2 n=1 Tax=Lottia gigantea TaxID=225164 RepID=V4A1N7_LOTGI|nr:hypothetical protein LOTGIDRAFT_229340 [Lottia gigantea]ESO87211.1 hypothetical protein LOTGIDRAFT_229340 [Lottia gigantea]